MSNHIPSYNPELQRAYERGLAAAQVRIDELESQLEQLAPAIHRALIHLEGAAAGVGVARAKLNEAYASLPLEGS